MSDSTPQDPDATGLIDLREKVYALMRKRHAIDPSLAWGLVLLGGAVVVATGFAVAFVMAFIAFNLGLGFNVRFWLVMYGVLMVPILVWQERHTRGGFFTLVQADVDLRRDPDSVGDYLVHRTRSHAVAVVEAILWGPRALIAGVRALRGVQESGLDLVLPEAADTLTLMLSLESAVKIKDLVPPGEDAMRLTPILKWMDQHDYIGISSKGDRVWVSSFAKKHLAREYGNDFLPKTHQPPIIKSIRPPTEPLL